MLRESKYLIKKPPYYIDIVKKDISPEKGQVSTPEPIAKLMTQLLLENIGKNAKVIDPCFGDNVFFDSIISLDKHYKKEPILFGTEKDNRFLQSPANGEALIIKDFFDVNDKFDALIMNPPYVRQELLCKPTSFNYKQKILKKIKFANKSEVSPKSNLFVYFFLKAYDILNEGGVLVAITYDSWLNSDYGDFFRKFLVDNFRIERIYWMKEKPFEKAIVGATILLLKKGGQSSGIEFYIADKSGRFPLKKKKIISVKKFLSGAIAGTNNLNANFKAIGELLVTPPRRGIETPANGVFIWQSQPGFAAETKPLVKSASKIKKYSINEADGTLLTFKNQPLPEVECQIFKIAKEKRYTNLVQMMNSKKAWWKTTLVPPGNILFNYYLRNRIDFILNPKRLHSSNNFYNIYCGDIEPFLLLAILNSTHTIKELLSHSKNQGNGLRKIQLNRFLETRLLDPSKISESDRNALYALGEKLSLAERGQASDLISHIDNIIGKYGGT